METDGLRELVGCEVMFYCMGISPFKATVLRDTPDLLLVRGGNNATVTRLVKNKIVVFKPVGEEPHEYVPFHLLFCENREIDCDGVQYVSEGAGFTRSDFDVFMGPCPMRCDGCRSGTRGELRSVDPAYLRQALTGTLFGDYPEGGSDGCAGDDAQG